MRHASHMKRRSALKTLAAAATAGFSSTLETRADDAPYRIANGRIKQSVARKTELSNLDLVMTRRARYGEFEFLNQMSVY